ncbi:glycerol-3-phosphate 1-O-acyltransferase PlsY [Athalassotoga saccharophila]|uniref:glycerol-3-phosphate 1-O-acyltransferase PlsY n=1 Tax=Athalassotoga saccharophila TaxID=1441386 RepID=UPI00137A8C89|nr:glycerol-3-phosphate 1-O-acyltransferase PlsY [Athalassotoga saccharophila]BBJ28455.1 glycerol-3-phosphate acyltransferase [Athalassotoga saccharophila]
MINEILWIILSYLVGSIPFSYILPHLKGVDVRKVGSGNVGGTNALRAAGPLIGFASMFLDIAKSFVMVLLARLMGFPMPFVLLSGTAAVIGHDYPIYMKFRGGKGVASTLGFMLAVNPFVALGFLVIWLILTLTTKYVSLASMVGIGFALVLSFFFGEIYFGFALIFLFVLSVYRHHENIKRLVNRRENKMDLINMLKQK